MAKWKVISRVYDDGSAEVHMSEAAENELSHYKAEELFDLYVDVCDTFEDAAALLNELLVDERKAHAV